MYEGSRKSIGPKAKPDNSASRPELAPRPKPSQKARLQARTPEPQCHHNEDTPSAGGGDESRRFTPARTNRGVEIAREEPRPEDRRLFQLLSTLTQSYTGVLGRTGAKTARDDPEPSQEQEERQNRTADQRYIEELSRIRADQEEQCRQVNDAFDKVNAERRRLAADNEKLKAECLALLEINQHLVCSFILTVR